MEVDIEMWKNFPLPPWGIARVKKNLCPSWEKSGTSFCREGRKNTTPVCVYMTFVSKTCLPGFLRPQLFTCSSSDTQSKCCLFILMDCYATRQQGSSVLITYLSVQPALTLILVFLEIITGYELKAFLSPTNDRKKDKSVSILQFCYCQQIKWRELKNKSVLVHFYLLTDFHNLWVAFSPNPIRSDWRSES